MCISLLHRWNVRLLARALALAIICLFASPAFAGPGLPGMHEKDGPHFRYYYDAAAVLDVERIQQSAEEAYGRLTGLLGFAPTNRIPVVLYANRDAFRAASNIKRRELVVGTAGSADDVIRLDASKTLESPSRVIGHEVTHVFLFEMLGTHVDALPLWMHEGLAQEGGGANALAARNNVVDAMLTGRLLALNDLTAKFPEGDDGGLAYDEGQVAVGALLDRGGWPRMRTLLIRMKNGASFDAAMQAVYGMSATEWETAWVRSLRSGARAEYWMQVATWVIPGLMFIALAWGAASVRRRRRRQIREEEPIPELEPPAWWREDEFRK
jgi:hypothetical protein